MHTILIMQNMSNTFSGGESPLLPLGYGSPLYIHSRFSLLLPNNAVASYKPYAYCLKFAEDLGVLLCHSIKHIYKI